MKTRDVELYIGLTDHTWHTISVYIPADTLEDKIEEVAVNKGYELLNSLDLSHRHSEMAFIGIYHISSMEESI